MMQLFKQPSAVEQEPTQPYLISKNWITIQYKDFIIQAQGFSSLDLDLKHTYQVCPYYSLFQLKKVKLKDETMNIKNATQQTNKNSKNVQDNIIMFGDVVTIQHVLSGKYLSYNFDFNNKSEIKLKAILSSSCEFCIKPIYKCQMTRSKKVRVNQQIIIYPNQTRTSKAQNIALVVTQFVKGKQNQLKLQLKINEESYFTITRKNLQKKQKSSITTMNIYQLANIQTNKTLSYKKQVLIKQNMSRRKDSTSYEVGMNIISSIIKEKNIIVDGKFIKLSFQDCINQYHTFLSFVTQKSAKMINKGKILQEKIQYGEKIVIRVFQQGYLLSFKSNTAIQLTENYKQSCLFILQQYDLQDSNMQENSIIKLRHYQTGLYFSLPTPMIPTIHLQQFGLLNTFMLCNVEYSKLHMSLFVNQNYNVLKNILDKSQNQAMEQDDINSLKKTLRDVIEYIYRDKNCFQLFNVMQSPNITTQSIISSLEQQIKEKVVEQRKDIIKFQMSKVQQNLLGNIGFLQIIHILGKKFLNKMKDDKSQKEYLSNKQKNSKKHKQEEQMKYKSKRQNQQFDDISDIQEILMYMMMITAGICHDNSSNVKTLLNNLNFYFQCIGQVKSSVECLFHIFNNKKDIIFILASSTLSIKNKNISYLQLLLIHLTSKQLKTYTKISVIKLLECLVLINNGPKKQKIIHHERILINSFSQQQKKGLKQFFYNFSSNQYDDMIIKKGYKDDPQELEDFIAKYSRQSQEIILLKQQINFICSLCYGNDFRNLEFFRTIMSEDMILRYLKSSLYPQFKQLFMRGLIQIYLNQARNKLSSKSILIIAEQGLHSEATYQQPSLSNRLMSSSINQKSQYDELELQQISKKHPSYSPKLQKIQNLVLQITRKAIKNELIDRSFYRNIQALRKFLQLQILDQNQVVQFKKILIQFIKKYYNEIFKGGDKKILVKQILKIIIYYQKISVQNLNTKFITILQNLRKNKQHKKDTDFKKPLLQWQKFIQQQINQTNPEKQLDHELSFVSKLIEQSLKHKCQYIFNQSSQLFYLLKQKESLMLQNLKDKIIIDNQQTLGFFKRSKVQSQLFIKNVSEYMMNNAPDYDRIAALHKIDQSAIQINYLFHQNIGNIEIQGWEKINGLAQNIIRQSSILDSCISFISQFMGNIVNDSPQNLSKVQKRQEKDQSNKLVSKFDSKPDLIFQNLFQLLNKFIKNNHTNFSIVCTYLPQLKPIYNIRDEGQIKFLFNLSKQTNSRETIGKVVQQLALIGLKQNQDPVPYALLIISYLIRDEFQQSFVKDTVQKISKLLMSQDVFRQIFKINSQKKYKYKWIYTTIESKQQQNMIKNENWGVYLLLLFNFFQMLVQTSTQRVELLANFRKCVTLEMLLQILEYPDIMDGVQNCEGFSIVLLKKQVISIIESVYMKQFKQSRSQFQKMLTFIQKINSKLFYFRSMNKQMNENEPKMTLVYEIRNGQTNQTGKLLKEYQKYQRYRNSLYSFQKYQNPIYLTMTIFSPFIFKILNVLLLNPSKQYQKSESSQFEIGSLLNLSFQRYKQYVSKISSKDVYEHKREYAQAIKMVEELTNKKIGRNLSKKQSKTFDQDEGSDQDNQQQKFQTIPKVFINSNLSNLYINIMFQTNPTQKYVYQSIFSLLYTQYYMNYKAPIQLKSTKQSIQSSFTLFMKLAQIQGNGLEIYLRILEAMINKQKSGLELMRGIQYTQQYHSIICNIIQKQQSSTTQISAFLSFSNKLFLSYIKSQLAMPSSIKQIIFVFTPKMMELIQKVFQTEIILYSTNKIQHQMNLYCSCQKVNYNFNCCLCIENVLQWMRNALIVTTVIQQENLFWIIQNIMEVFRKYTDYIILFSSKYITRQLNNKIILILQILYQAMSMSMSGNNQKVIIYLIQRQIWDDMNLILSLNDNLQKNQEQMQNVTSQTLNRCMKSQVKKFPKVFLEQVMQNYKISETTVGKINSVLQKNYPLLPMKSLFSELKYYAIMLIKSFTLQKYSLSYQLFSRIQIKIIDKNINQIYQKHQYLFQQYSISSQYPEMANLNAQDYIIAKNMKIQNGVNLLSIKMFIQDSLGGSQTVQQFYQYKVNSASKQKIGSAVSAITEFLTDFVLLFTSCFKICIRRKEKVAAIKNQQQIFQFFIQKTGRVQIISDNKIYSWDFMIRPQCKRNKYRQRIFIKSVNFISIQLKLESIIRQAQNIIVYYNNEYNFYERYHRIKIISFLDKNIAILRMSSFVLVITCNILLIVNSSQLQQYFSRVDFTDPYLIILIINFFVGILIVFIYCIKEIPFLVALTQNQLSKKFNSVGSTYNKNSTIYFLIIVTRVLFEPRTIYYIFYLSALSLSFYNKLFISLLLLDVMAQTSALKNILLSVWRPKLSILLTIISFTLVQYFSSIIIFFNFKSATFGKCATLGSCFGFIFVTTYKAVSGFVGYLFQLQQQSGAVNFQVTIFQIFQDIYVIVIFQIFFALILAIIIDNFTMIRAQQTNRKQNLNHSCLVCNLDRSIFNTSSKINFKSHIAISHNIWNYFFFYDYVLKKPQLERNKFQREIGMSKNTEWLPKQYSKGIHQPGQEEALHLKKMML